MWRSSKRRWGKRWRTASGEQSAWPICVGILLTYIGMALIGLGGWCSFELSLRCLIYLAGFILFLGGFLLIWKDLLSAPACPEEPTAETPELEGTYLGSFALNGHSFKAFECETDMGRRQFRLISSPPLNSEREAAYIRYLVNEGLVENIWRGMSKKIEEEATWAFFP